MTIQLAEHSERFVREMVRSGRYASENEVVEKALQLLEESDEQSKLAELRLEIGIGIEQADRGDLSPFDPHATLARIRSREASGTGKP